MAIQVGDAIFNFLGDTTNLDQAWTKAEQDATAKAPVVQQQINTVGDAWTQSGQAATNAAQQTSQAAEQMGAAAQGAAQASSQAAASASPEWFALAKATDTATRATIEHNSPRPNSTPRSKPQRLPRQEMRKPSTPLLRLKKK
jgi:hypothetical protein